ncbi:hypothetical protein GCM10009123_20230 [Kangiella japonica]|uniref:DUF3465 domain-containing protein n=1 Tax=Kangiella japonica TaxID=647384 RepID=A0ABP3CRK6_9GAMM
MTHPKNKRLAVLFLAILAVVFYLAEGSLGGIGDSHKGELNHSEEQNSNAHKTLQGYFDKKVSGKMITINAKITKVLRDDLHPPRHQRFIIKLDNNLTVLVTHNTDLAPRVKSIKAGEWIKVTGQYEWNSKGGVIHWTHHDPQGRRDGGQIIYKGKVYR